MANKVATRVAYGKALINLAESMDFVVFDADLAAATNTYVFKEKYPERFFNIGIAEANMVGIAAGMAASGVTVVANSFAMFTAGKAFEQIRNSVAYPNLNVKLVGTHAGLSVGEDGATHQCLEDIGIMRIIPNMTVICPSDAIETKEAVKAALTHCGPVYIRLGRLPVNIINDSPEYKFELGKGVLAKQGNDAAIIATGLMVQEALEAAGILANEGLYIRVINIHTIKPIDRDILIKAAKETGAIVTAEEHNVIGGLGSAVAEVITENCPVPLLRHGVYDIFGKSGKPHELMAKYKLNAETLVLKVKEVLQLKGR